MSIKNLGEGERADFASYDDLHPGRFLKCGHLLGAEKTLTIKAFYAENMGQKRDPETGATKDDLRGILEFVEIPEHYATQKTNEALLKAMFGSDPKAAIGKRVTLAPSRDTFGRDEVDAIRICGSPDIERDLVVTVKYAAKTRRKPKVFNLRRTTAAQEPKGEEVKSDARMAVSALENCADLAALEAVAETLRGHRWSPDASREIKGALSATREKLKPKTGEK